MVLKKAGVYFYPCQTVKSAIHLLQHMLILSLGMLRLSRKNHRISRNLLECKKMAYFIETKRR
jgi:hypothetical protein